MRKVNIGTTGISVTELCHGTLILGTLQANLSPEEGAVAIRKSLELGVNFFDTAAGYGTYPHLALGLQGVARDRVVIASKSQARSYDQMKADVDRCLRELSLEQVGIFHLHMVPSLDELNERRGALECLIEYKERGLVGAIGASTHTVAGVRAINEEPVFDVVFPVLNKKGLGIIDGNLQDMLDALVQSREKGKFVYAMKPLGGGHLYQEVEEAFRYLRELPLCDAVAVGMKNEAEVEMDVAIFNDNEVGEYLRQRVNAVARRLVVYDRCIGCGLCVDECDQGAISLVNDKAVVDDSKCILCGYCAAVCPEYVIRVV
jgi:predicted aldo/keto reductase-like oxidoreductase